MPSGAGMRRSSSDEIRIELGDGLLRPAGLGFRSDRACLVVEECFEHGHVLGIVVDDQDPVAHAEQSYARSHGVSPSKSMGEPPAHWWRRIPL